MPRTFFIVVFLLLAGAQSVHAAEAAPPGEEYVPAISPEKLIEAMDDAEYDYYLRAFDYAMDNLKPGDKYEWKSYRTSGYFEVDPPVVHSNTVCRNYREYLSQSAMYSFSTEGVGCKRVGRSGWCRLKRTDMLSCALEKDHSIKGQVEDALNSVKQSMDEKSTFVKSKQYHWWPF